MSSLADPGTTTQDQTAKCQIQNDSLNSQEAQHCLQKKNQNTTEDQTAKCQIKTDSLNSQEAQHCLQKKDHNTTEDQTAKCQIQNDSLISQETQHGLQKKDRSTTKDQTANCQIQIDSLNPEETLHGLQRDSQATAEDQTANCQILIESLTSQGSLHDPQRKDASWLMMPPSKQTSTGPSCEGHDHFQLVTFSDVFNIGLDKMFELIFTDSCVQRMLAQRRHRSDIVWFPWRSEADGSKRRNLTYLVLIKSRFRPKTLRITEKQVLYSESQPGHFYFVDAECVSQEVLYGIDFSVGNRCYISRIADDKCQLCISSRLNYHNSNWVPAKNFISKTAADGISKNFQVLAELLRKEESKPNLSCTSQDSASERLLAPVSDSSAMGSPGEASTEYVEDTGLFSTGIIYFFFTCSLICAVCFTGVLFYGLWTSVNNISLMTVKGLDNERRSHISSRPPVEALADNLVSQLNELLSSSTKLIETIAESLEELSENESKIQQCLQEKQVCPKN